MNRGNSITDFGLAHAANEDDLTQSSFIAGTPAYMSPEQAHGKRVDHRSDLYSLGSVLYAISTGQPPFLGRTAIEVLQAVRDVTPRPASNVNPDMPERLSELIAKLHAKDPIDRPTSAEVVAKELQAIERQQMAGGTPAPANAVVRPVQTVAQVLDWYSTRATHSRSAVAEKERQRVLGLFRAAYGHLSLEEATPDDLADFIYSQAGAKSNNTRLRLRGTVNKPFNLAVKRRRIRANPFAGLEIPDGPRGRDWTDAEYRAVLRAAAPYFRRFVVFVRFSGCRPGECRGLRWDHIREAVAVLREHKTAQVGPSPRRIHLNQVSLKLLEWLHRHKTHKEFVFTNRRNKPWTIRALCNHLAILRKRIGLPKDFKMHGGRHTFATHALMNGVDICTVSSLLGHSTTSGADRYVHLCDKNDHLRAAAERAIGAGRTYS